MSGPAYHGRTHGVKDEAGTYVNTGTDPVPGLAEALNAIEAVAGSGGGALIQPGHRIGATEDRWYAAGQFTATSLGTNLTTANVADAFPFIPSRDMTLTQVYVQVTSGAAGNVRIGLYTDDGNLYPDALLFDTGNVDTSTTGVKQTAISQAVTAETLYWAVCAYSNSSVQMRSLQAAACVPMLGVGSTTGTTAPLIGIGWRLSHTFGALPDPFTASAGIYDIGMGQATGMFFLGT